ncbi:MAG: MotA/TolQ/ExbB proton channel family protein [Planctomycetes bacterium]|nr:MotA/TolQ/ExbB proton channel family protein [Planctomycetota bacterium]MBL7038561.1 MotA/TolQ/ExbB proton channel family protein [Pirellulaceae bacterium]
MVYLLLAAVALGSISTASVVLAQAADETLDERLAETDATPSGAASATDSDTPKKKRTVLRTLMDGGFVGVLILLLSMVAVGFVVEHALTIRKSVLMPELVIAELDELIGQNRIDEAITACNEPQNQSLVAYVVLAGLERYKGSEFGFAEYKAAVEEAGEDQTGRLYRKTEVLGLIGSIAPMLGLTGTVLGMITAFNTIAASGGMAKPDELAGGIGQALVTTLMGLVVAIPTMIAFSYFRNRIDSIVAEAGKCVEQIMMPLGRRK